MLNGRRLRLMLSSAKPRRWSRKQTKPPSASSQTRMPRSRRLSRLPSRRKSRLPSPLPRRSRRPLTPLPKHMPSSLPLRKLRRKESKTNLRWRRSGKKSSRKRGTPQLMLRPSRPRLRPWLLRRSWLPLVPSFALRKSGKEMSLKLRRNGRRSSPRPSNVQSRPNRSYRCSKRPPPSPRRLRLRLCAALRCSKGLPPSPRMLRLRLCAALRCSRRNALQPSAKLP